jgi:hypothetical protein
VLVEGINDAKKLISNKNFEHSTIISFDFIAHKYLEQRNIPHQLVEDVIPIKEQNLIDNKTVDLILNWHKQVKFKEKNLVAGFNLGRLIEIEISNYFFLALKRTVGIINLIKCEQPNEIICMSLEKYVDCLSKNSSIKITKLEENISSNKLYFDTIEIPLTIAGKTKSIKFSRSTYMKIKNIIENFTNTLSGSGLNIHNKTKNPILLLDYNPVQYFDLFFELSSLNYDVLLLNQRRPAIWNKESFSKVKKSHSKVLKLKQFKTKEIKLKIVKIKEEIWKEYEKIFEEESNFYNIFMIKNYSFWEAIKLDFKKIIQKRFEESIEMFILTKELFTKIKINCVLDWAHTGAEEKIVTHFAKMRNIPIVSLQHAIYPLNQKWDKYHPIYPHLPSQGVKEAVWGKKLEKYVLEQGLKKDQILLSGSPRHDSFFKEKSNINNETVLIAANLFAHFNFAGNDTRAYELLEKFIQEIIYILKKNKKKIIIKLHPSQGYHDIKSFIQSIDSSIPIYQNQNILDLINLSDHMISLNYSTILVDAMILKKPTMVIISEEQGFDEEEMIKEESTIVVKNLSELESKIEKLLDNKNREKLIENGNKFLDEYFVNQGNASRNLAKLIDQTINFQ